MTTGPGGPQPAILSEPLVIYQGATWSLPIRLMAGDDLIDTTSYTAQLTVRTTPEGGQAFFASTGNNLITVGFDPPKRANSTVYALGQQVVPTTLNGFIYEVTTAGTSAGSAPTWPTTIGQTVTDNTVVWTAVSTDAIVTNLRVGLEPVDTDDTDEWGYGSFSLELTDTFGHEYPILEGFSVLRRAITRPAS